MTRAVPDTNVCVSALVFGGKPARVLQLAAAGTFQLIVSESIQAELLEALATRFAWPADRADTVTPVEFLARWVALDWYRSNPDLLVGSHFQLRSIVGQRSKVSWL